MAPMTPADLETPARLDELLTLCVRRDGSDLHLVAGLPPHLRVHGELDAIAGAPELTSEDTRRFAEILLRRMANRDAGEPCVDAALAARGSVDGAVTTRDNCRFRFNIFRRQSEISIALRRLEDQFRTLAQLGLPDSLYQLCRLRDGLVIVSGPTGAGKSTTLAALLDFVNRNRSGHIITIEDPIEYVHQRVRCVINQRQVGIDAPTFNDALVASLRQDPDVVLVGEIRDLETIRTAITAAETGHLVFTTLHAGDCVGSIERLVSVFPSGEQDGVRRQLALVLRGVVAQHLLPGPQPTEPDATSVARTVASEILMVTPAVANLIATARSAQIYSAMESGASLGMQTLEQDLARLWVAGHITETTAETMARNSATLRDRATLLRRRSANGNGNGNGNGHAASHNKPGNKE